MIDLRNSPFLWLSFILLLAINAYGYLDSLSADVRIVLFAGSFGFAIASLFQFAPRKQFWSTITIAILIFCAGLLRVDEFDKNLYPDTGMSASLYMEGMVMVKQVLKNKVDAVTLKCQQVSLADASDSLKIFRDRFILVYIKTVFPLQFFPGDHIGIQGYVSKIKGPMNPYAFDAQKYYNTIGIRHTMYCTAEDLQTDFEPNTSLARITAQWQSFLSSIVRNHTRNEVAQLTNALVWGDRSDMDEEVRDAFADSGAMHVLSVSGMHVAIVYSMLLLIFGPPGTGGFGQRMMRFAIYTFAIILYVGLSGAGPAVVRAGLMIILFLFGKSMGWNTQIWNLLGFAAFMMFWLNPYIWENLGFQLSFLAMAGILLFAKPVIRFLSFKNKILHLIWEITALSITAQIFILPVLLGQFHQFPLTFIISSIVAIPASYLVMGGALINVIFSFMGINFLWPVVDWTGHYFIVVMKWISAMNPLMHYSLSVISGILMMSMAVLFSFGIVFKWQYGKWLGYACGLFLLVSLGCNRSKQWRENEMIVYHLPKGLLIDIIQNGNCISIQDESVTYAAIEFTTRGYRCHKDIISSAQINVHQDFSSEGLWYENYILHVSENKILLYTEFKDDIQDQYFENIIICGGKNIWSVKDFICSHSTSHFIIPAHLGKKLRKPVLKHLEENKIPYYDISSKGYFKIDL